MNARAKAEFRHVSATLAEAEQFRAKAGHEPNVPRLECRRCGKRLWGSGLGVGSHRRACKGLS